MYEIRILGIGGLPVDAVLFEEKNEKLTISISITGVQKGYGLGCVMKGLWDSHYTKLLGILVDKYLYYKMHMKNVCKKVNQKISAPARVARFLSFYKRHMILGLL